MGKILIAIIFISAIMDILPISKSIFEVNFLNRYIGKIKKGLVSLCLTGALLVSSVAVAAMPEIIGLKDILNRSQHNPLGRIHILVAS